MLFIGRPYIERKADKSRLVCDIAIDDKETKNVWFEVDREYEQYLCTERSDAYVIGLLNWAMRAHHDMTCEAPISEELLFSLNEYLIPALAKYAPGFRAVKINAPLAGESLPNAGAVGTGLSCGIDSLHAILKQQHSCYPQHNLTHLCINNVGAFNSCYDDYGIDRARKECYENAKKVAQEIGLPLIITDSNFQTAFQQNHLKTHTYSSMFAVFCMQKMWRVYFYGSSGYDFSCFNLKNNDQDDCAFYELLSLDCFSTRSLKIYSEGGAQTRLEKTADIVDYDIARKYLHVCTRKSTNCGICPKCRRTMLTLDALGKLDDFAHVFDVAYYRAHRREYLLWLYEMHRQNDEMNAPTYKRMKKEITPTLKFLYRWNKIKKYLPLSITEEKIKINLFFCKISFKKGKQK